MRHTLRTGGSHKIAWELKKYNVDTEVLDFVDLMQPRDFLKILESRKHNRYLFIGFTFMFWDYQKTNKLIKILKKYFPNTKFVMGGTADFIKDLGMDYYINSFAEKSIPHLIDDILGKKEIKHQKRFNGKWINALHDYPAWHENNYYFEYLPNSFMQPFELATIEMQRGCRFKCKYCSFPLIGLKENNITTEQKLYDHIMSIRDKTGITNFILAEDTFNDRTDKVVSLANVVAKLDFNPMFAAFIRIDLYHRFPEMMKAAAAAGIVGHAMGIETFNHNSGKFIGKGLHPDIVKETLLNTEKYFETHGLHNDFYGYTTNIAGLPYDTKDEILEMNQWYWDNWYPNGWRWFALRITKSGADHMSAFGENLEKYGYTELNETYDFKQYNQDALIRELVNWKNTHMTYMEAEDLVNEMVGSSQQVGMDSWSYVAACAEDPKFHKMDVPKLENPQCHPMNIDHLNKYIERKINYAK